MAHTPAGTVFETRYVNEYGDDWVFRYEPETATGTVEERNERGWGDPPAFYET